MTSLLPNVADVLFLVYGPFQGNGRQCDKLDFSFTLPIMDTRETRCSMGFIAVAGVLLFFIRWERGSDVFTVIAIVHLPALIIHFIPIMDSSLQVTLS